MKDSIIQFINKKRGEPVKCYQTSNTQIPDSFKFSSLTAGNTANYDTCIMRHSRNNSKGKKFSMYGVRLRVFNELRKSRQSKQKFKMISLVKPHIKESSWIRPLSYSKSEANNDQCLMHTISELRKEKLNNKRDIIKLVSSIHQFVEDIENNEPKEELNDDIVVQAEENCALNLISHINSCIYCGLEIDVAESKELPFSGIQIATCEILKK